MIHSFRNQLVTATSASAGRVPRRHFLSSLSAMGLGATFPFIRSARCDEPNRDIRMAVIGLRGRGGGHLEGFGPRVIAICDCDQRVLDGCRERLGNATEPRQVETYTDFRRLLERPDIDAVSIATPNHTHALIAIEAARAGKHVYVEKPVSQTIWEGQQLAKAARRYERIIQCGTQSRSSASLQAAHRFVHDGELGGIQYAHGTCFKRRPSIGKLDQPLPIPDHIDFNLWCGPVETHEIRRPQLHYDWHWDFATGNGDLGNQGIHQVDQARWFLGESQLAPRTFSIGGRLGYDDAGNTPNTQIVWFDYPRAPLLFEVRGLPESVQSDKMDTYRGMQVGVIIQCENGHVRIPSYYEAIAYDKEGQVIQHWRGGTDQDHYDNFLQAVSANDASVLTAEVSQGHCSSALCHLGNLAFRVGSPTHIEDIARMAGQYELLADALERTLRHLAANGVDAEYLTMGPWLSVDPETESLHGNDAAEQLVHRHDREPFVVPTIG